MRGATSMATVLACALVTSVAVAQTPVIIRGGWIFASTGDQVVPSVDVLITMSFT